MKAIVCCLAASVAMFAWQSRPVQQISTDGGAVKVTPIRHASVMIEAGEDVVHIDPWSQGNYEGLPKATLILVTDIHRDHLDPAIIRQLRDYNTTVVVPEAAKAQLGDMNVTVMRNGEVKTFGKWTVEAIPMYNMKRGPSEGQVFHEKGRGNGYIVTYGGKRFYFSGDTEGIPEMRALKNIDVAFVAMNLPNTMSPEEAADAVREFRPKVVYPYHYRNSDLQVFARALQDTGIEVRILDWYY
jgi:L-ascorbate metabolism protein UlaG (beta-lactamase superfamily)